MINLSLFNIAILATDYFEEKELFRPLEILKANGASVEIIAPHLGEIKGLAHVKPGQSIKVDRALDEAYAEDYDALVVPGGAFNVDHLRMDYRARAFITKFMERSKLVAVICHGPWLLASSDLLHGRSLTSYFTIQDDIRNAGGSWRNQPVVKDGNLITSRNPDDLPAFNAAIINALTSIRQYTPKFLTP